MTQNRVPTRIDCGLKRKRKRFVRTRGKYGELNPHHGSGDGDRNRGSNPRTGTGDRIPDSVLGTGKKSNDELVAHASNVMDAKRVITHKMLERSTPRNCRDHMGGRIPLVALEMDKRTGDRILGRGRGTASSSLRWGQGRATESPTRCWGWKRGQGTGKRIPIVALDLDQK